MLLGHNAGFFFAFLLLTCRYGIILFACFPTWISSLQGSLCYFITSLFPTALQVQEIGSRYSNAVLKQPVEEQNTCKKVKE